MDLNTSEQPRHALWIELFFDLVFVVTVAKLAHHLHGDPGIAQFGEFLLLFAAPWWAWLQFTTYANTSRSPDGARTRLLMLAGMACMAVMGVAIPDALHDRSYVYALGYAASKIVVFLMWLPGAREGLRAWNMTRTALFNGIPFVIWIGSIFLPQPYQAIAWMVALIFEVAFLVIVQRIGNETAYQVSHIVERVGLFVIIVLGESVAASINSLDEHWSGPGWIVLGLGFVWFAAIWWAYFDFGSAAAERELESRGNSQVRDVMGLGHFPIVASLTAMAAGLGTAVAEPGHLPFGAVVAMCGGLAAYRSTFLLMSLRVGRSIKEGARWAVPALLIALTTLAISGYLPAWAIVAILAAEAVFQLLRGIHRTRRLA